MVEDAWNGMYPVLPGLSSSCGGSILFGVSYGVVALFLGLMLRSISGIDYGGFTSMCVVTSIAVCSLICCGYLFPLVSTTVSSASPIIRPLLSVKIKFIVPLLLAHLLGP